LERAKSSYDVGELRGCNIDAQINARLCPGGIEIVLERERKIHESLGKPRLVIKYLAR
jgi:hypothetical protein